MPERRARRYLLVGVPVAQAPVEKDLSAVLLLDAEIDAIAAGCRTATPHSTAVGAQLSDGVTLAAVEADLDATDGLRPVLQARARAELSAAGVPLTRTGVLRRAHVLLREHRTQHPGAASDDDPSRRQRRGRVS